MQDAVSTNKQDMRVSVFFISVFVVAFVAAEVTEMYDIPGCPVEAANRVLDEVVEGRDHIREKIDRIKGRMQEIDCSGWTVPGECVELRAEWKKLDKLEMPYGKRVEKAKKVLGILERAKLDELYWRRVAYNHAAGAEPRTAYIKAAVDAACERYVKEDGHPVDAATRVQLTLVEQQKVLIQIGMAQVERMVHIEQLLKRIRSESGKDRSSEETDAIKFWLDNVIDV